MIDTPPRLRPTMVTVLGWIWIALGSFMTLTSLMVLMFSIGLSELMHGEVVRDAGMSGVPGAGLMVWVFGHFNLLAAGQLFIAILVLVAGVQLLHLRRWARVFLEAVCWLGLAYMVSFGVWWGFVWVGMAGQIPAGAPDAPSAALMSGFGVGFMAMVVLFYAVPTGALIWFLRHETVRGAVKATDDEIAG